MHTIVARNVCYALPLGVDHLNNFGKEEDSRAGKVLVSPGPVTTVYHKPWERVLFSQCRDANPFFHLAEAIWMMSGRNDAEFLNRYVHDFGLRYAEDGKLRASYGYRWRDHWSYDQLAAIVSRLKHDKNDRRIVLSMWDPAEDLLFVDARSHLQKDGRKDIPCNTHAYFRIVENRLEMTVCCRSNDIIWGAYGANAVHFSVLQEYLATAIGVEIGNYYQISNNFHAYRDELSKMEERTKRDLFFGLFDDRYHADDIPTTPLVDNPATFLQECGRILEHPEARGMDNKFLSGTVGPALMAHQNYKSGYPAESRLAEMEAEDWRIACTEWINRRLQSRATRDAAVKSQDTTPGHISSSNP